MRLRSGVTHSDRHETRCEINAEPKKKGRNRGEDCWCLFLVCTRVAENNSLPNCILVPHPVKALSHTLRPTHDQFAGQIQVDIRHSRLENL